jgi:hypothetical protein
MHTEHQAHAGGGFAAGLFCGITLGAAIGLLFAPFEGRRLRQELTSGAERIRRETLDRYRWTVGNVGSFVERGREALEAGRQTFENARVNAARMPHA